MQPKLWLYKGYLARYMPYGESKPTYQHRFGGSHQIAGAECPLCKASLVRYLELDTSDPRLRLQGLGINRLPLLFCPRCPLAIETEFAYRLVAHDQIQIVQYTSLETLTKYDLGDYPAPDYPDFYPERWASLLPMPDELQLLFRLFNRGYIDDEPKEFVPEWHYELYPHHQVGGEPLVVIRFSGYEHGWRIVCPLCGETMPFLACIGNEYIDTVPTDGATEGGFHQGMMYGELLFHLCGQCKVVSAYYQGD
jgi:hypothetical protein